MICTPGVLLTGYYNMHFKSIILEIIRAPPAQGEGLQVPVCHESGNRGTGEVKMKGRCSYVIYFPTHLGSPSCPNLSS